MGEAPYNGLRNPQTKLIHRHHWPPTHHIHLMNKMIIAKNSNVITDRMRAFGKAKKKSIYFLPVGRLFVSEIAFFDLAEHERWYAW